jgi:hypothetical protein
MTLSKFATWLNLLMAQSRPLEVAAAKRYNPPGRSQLAYRMADYQQFVQRLLERLPAQPGNTVEAVPQLPLRGLNLEGEHDFTIALLKAWAVVGDVLTFYQERIANEGYLRTCTESQSIMEFVRAIDYHFKPSIAAETYLAFTVMSDAPSVVTLPKGTGGQSVGGQAVVFETTQQIEARARWNAMPIFIPTFISPQLILPQATQMRLSGVKTDLKPSEKLLIRGVWQGTTTPQDYWCTLKHVEANKTEAYTLLEWDTPLEPPDNSQLADTLLETIEVYKFEQQAPLFGHAAPLWSNEKDDLKRNYSPRLGGIYQSRDGGSSWTQRTGNLPAQSIRSLLVDPQGNLLAATNKGIFRSQDDGATWQAVNTGIRNKNIYFLTQADKDYLLAGGAAGGVYCSGDGGGTWQLLPGMLKVINHIVVDYRLPNTGIYNLCTFRDINQILWLYLATGAGIFRSSDNGTTWRPFNGGFPGAGPKINANLIVYSLLTVSVAVEGQIMPTTYLYAGTNRGIFRIVLDRIVLGSEGCWESCNNFASLPQSSYAGQPAGNDSSTLESQINYLATDIATNIATAMKQAAETEKLSLQTSTPQRAQNMILAIVKIIQDNAQPETVTKVGELIGDAQKHLTNCLNNCSALIKEDDPDLPRPASEQAPTKTAMAEAQKAYAYELLLYVFDKIVAHLVTCLTQITASDKNQQLIMQLAAQAFAEQMLAQSEKKNIAIEAIIKTGGNLVKGSSPITLEQLATSNNYITVAQAWANEICQAMTSVQDDIITAGLTGAVSIMVNTAEEDIKKDKQTVIDAIKDESQQVANQMEVAADQAASDAVDIYARQATESLCLDSKSPKLVVDLTVYTLVQQEQWLLAGTDQGVWQLDLNNPTDSWQPVAQTQPIPVHQLFRYQEQWLAATPQGLMIFSLEQNAWTPLSNWLQWLFTTGPLTLSALQILQRDQIPVEVCQAFRQFGIPLSASAKISHQILADRMIWIISDGDREYQAVVIADELTVYARFQADIQAVTADQHKGIILSTPVGDFIKTDWANFCLEGYRVDLNKTYRNIAKKTWLVLEQKEQDQEPSLTTQHQSYLITDLEDNLQRVDFTLSKDVTRLYAEQNTAFDQFDLRRTMAYFQSEPLALAISQEKQLDPVGGVAATQFKLAGVYDDLKPQQYLTLEGKRYGAQPVGIVGGVCRLSLEQSAQVGSPTLYTGVIGEQSPASAWYYGYQPLGLAEHNVFCLARVLTNAGEWVFVGTQSGLFAYDDSAYSAGPLSQAAPRSGLWHDLGLDQIQVNKVYARPIRHDAETAFEVYAATKTGLWRIHWTPSLSQISDPALNSSAQLDIQEMVVDVSGQTLYLGTKQAEVYTYSFNHDIAISGSWEEITEVVYLGSLGSQAPLQTLYVNADGLYVGTAQGLYRYAPTQKRFAPIQAFAHHNISAMTGTAEGMLYIGTSVGIFLYRPNLDQASFMGLRGQQISALLSETHDNKLYLMAGTIYDGLFIIWLPNGQWQQLYIGLSQSVQAMLSNNRQQVILGGLASITVRKDNPFEVELLQRRLLFTLSAAEFQPTLDQANITQALSQLFKSQRPPITLSDTAQIHLLIPRQRWLIDDGQAQYIIEAQLGDDLDVYSNPILQVMHIASSPNGDRWQQWTVQTQADFTGYLMAWMPSERQPGDLKFVATTNTNETVQTQAGFTDHLMVWMPSEQHLGDLKFVAAANTNEMVNEVVQIVDVIVAADRTYTTVNVSKPIENVYDPAKMTVCGNVAPANQGQTVQAEVLGSGDPQQQNQIFSLKRPPLTFALSANAYGAQPEIEVRVKQPANQPAYQLGELPQMPTKGEVWNLVDQLYQSGPLSHDYMVRLDNTGRVQIIFGDGKHGARLPAGMNNVQVSYRSAGHTTGNLAAHQITQLRSRPRGISKVTNPIPATGGIAAESIDTVKNNLPRAIRPLDRIVSLLDYQDFIANHVGIGQVNVQLIWNGRAKIVHITTAQQDGRPLDLQSSLYATLVESIKRSQASRRAFVIDTYTPQFFNIEATVFVNTPLDEMSQQSMRKQLTTTLLNTFVMSQRVFGQPVTAAEIINLLQQPAGVLAVEITKLHKLSNLAHYQAVLPTTLAHWDARQQKINRAELLLINGVSHQVPTLTGETKTKYEGIILNLVQGA